MHKTTWYENDFNWIVDQKNKETDNTRKTKSFSSAQKAIEKTIIIAKEN